MTTGNEESLDSFNKNDEGPSRITSLGDLGNSIVGWTLLQRLCQDFLPFVDYLRHARASRAWCLLASKWNGKIVGGDEHKQLPSPWSR